MIAETQEVQGIDARHIICVMAEEMTDARWEKIGGQLEIWQPESVRRGFGQSGQARAWLARFLRKPGWPDAETFEIWRTGSTWHCYRRKS